jgi:quercetin dioxygenase-like cupin family protein
MLATMHVDKCPVYHLPGRDWYYLIGPINTDAKNLAFGLAEFHPGETAPAHTHDTQEEIIYILEGKGDFITAEQVHALAPGVAVFIPPGLEHRIVVHGDQPLKLVTLFSPPVIPGAYDAAKK